MNDKEISKIVDDLTEKLLKLSKEYEKKKIEEKIKEKLKLKLKDALTDVVDEMRNNENLKNEDDGKVEDEDGEIITLGLKNKE